MKSQETQEKDRAFCEHEQSFSPAIYYSAISPSRLSHWKAVSLQLQASARAAAGVLLFPSTLTCLLKKEIIPGLVQVKLNRQHFWHNVIYHEKKYSLLFFKKKSGLQ